MSGDKHDTHVAERWFDLSQISAIWQTRDYLLSVLQEPLKTPLRRGTLPRALGAAAPLLTSWWINAVVLRADRDRPGEMPVERQHQGKPSSKSERVCNMQPKQIASLFW